MMYHIQYYISPKMTKDITKLYFLIFLKYLYIVISGAFGRCFNKIR